MIEKVQVITYGVQQHIVVPKHWPPLGKPLWSIQNLEHASFDGHVCTRKQFPPSAKSTIPPTINITQIGNISYYTRQFFCIKKIKKIGYLLPSTMTEAIDIIAKAKMRKLIRIAILFCMIDKKPMVSAI